jgi:hypothetical protein
MALMAEILTGNTVRCWTMLFSLHETRPARASTASCLLLTASCLLRTCQRGREEIAIDIAAAVDKGDPPSLHAGSFL